MTSFSAAHQTVYKHDVTCVPFQRDPPADTADYADSLIWRRLKVGNSNEPAATSGFAVLPENALF